jgi:hypothetical protein
MTELAPAATDVAAAANARSGFNRARAFRSIGFSIVVNAVLPYLAYRLLEPRFPHASITPLLVSTVFPLFGLVFAMARKRTVDAIAIISLVEISISIVVTLVASDIRLALVGRALQGTLTGLFFLATIPIGHPIIYYFARQFAAASTPEVAAGFAEAHRRDEGRTFRRLTALWGVATILVSVVHVWLATTVAPATYLFAAPIVGIGTNLVLVWWTIRYSTRRFMRDRPT